MLHAKMHFLTFLISHFWTQLPLYFECNTVVELTDFVWSQIAICCQATIPRINFPRFGPLKSKSMIELRATIQMGIYERQNQEKTSKNKQKLAIYNNDIL